MKVSVGSNPLPLEFNQILENKIFHFYQLFYAMFNYSINMLSIFSIDMIISINVVFNYSLCLSIDKTFLIGILYFYYHAFYSLNMLFLDLSIDKTFLIVFTLCFLFLIVLYIYQLLYVLNFIFIN